MIEKPIQAQMLTDGDRIVIYDAARLPAPAPAWFTPEFWPERSALDRGRGAAFALRTHFGDAVLRRYRRGGAVARVLKDSYVWTGVAQTRPVREFRLLAAAIALGLPVPRPLAAEVRRRGAFYSGDLLMGRIDAAQTLSACLATAADWGDLDWGAIGSTLGSIHAHGFEHADLNAHNLLLDDRARVWIIDWDRGRRRPPGDWTEQVLARLRRSLLKLHGARADADDAVAAWRRLLDVHAAAVAEVADA